MNMFSLNIRHEIKLLSRDRRFIILSALLILLCLYAGFNGQNLYELRNTELINAKADHDSLIALAHDVASAFEAGEKPREEFRVRPTYLSIATGTQAYMPTNPVSALAIGQSDLYAHQIKINSRGDIATLTFNQMNNPVQLLFGNFDLVFVLTYLIPLIIIAFTYNLQSQELESGRLKLVASNPINPKLWLLQRFLTRFVSLILILAVAILTTIIALKIDFNTRLAGMALITLAYICFWFSVSFLVNVLGKTSDKNAIVLLSMWIFLVLLIPSLVNQTANSIYPTPSRVVLLNEIRQSKKDLAKEQDKVMAEYLRNHPELVRLEENPNAYWERFFASHEMAEERLTPMIELFESRLQEQQKWVNSLSFLSPAIVFQNSFTNLAGTSASAYAGFRGSTIEFAKQWRDYFLPMVFENRLLTNSELENLPEFEYTVSYTSTELLYSLLMLNCMIFALLFMGFRSGYSYSIS